jgi:hypothetical protein
MEEFLRLQRLELLRQGAPDLDCDEWDVDQQQQPEDKLDLMDDQEDDGLEEADLAFITSILESFSQNESRKKGHIFRTRQSQHDPFCADFPPEGALMQKGAKQRMTPPKFNYNSTIKMPTAEQVSRFPTVEEEGTEEFLEESDIEDENHTEETASEDTPTICSITEKKKNSFAAWQPFIPSNWQGNFTKTRLLSPVGNPPLRHRAHLWTLLPC